MWTAGALNERPWVRTKSVSGNVVNPAVASSNSIGFGSDAGPSVLFVGLATADKKQTAAPASGQ